MNKIIVCLTSQSRILAIPYPSALPGLLENGEEVVKSWFYNKPRGLESFLKAHPKEEKIFTKGFAYWVLCRAFNIEENQNNYGLLKRELQEFSSKLFRAVRSLAGRIADQIKVFNNKLKGKSKTRHNYVNRHRSQKS